jgi:serine protease Do
MNSLESVETVIPYSCRRSGWAYHLYWQRQGYMLEHGLAQVAVQLFRARTDQRKLKMKRIIVMGWVVGLIVLALSLSVTSQARLEKSSVDPLQALNESLGELTTRISPAVVHIRVASFRSTDDDEEDDVRSQTLTKQRGSGSGVIVDPNGYIVTAFHVVEGERRIRVELDSRALAQAMADQPGIRPRSTFVAKMVGSFKDADLAILKIDASHLPTLLFSETDTLKQGQLVAALGSPEGLRNSLSLGVVSSVAQQIEPDDSMTYIQTDASLAPGSSGGPLVDVQGRVVGINVFSITDRGKHEGLGFAVPSPMVRFVYEQIRRYGCVPRASLGVDIQGITPTLATALRLPTDTGVIVTSVEPGSPADKASVKAGDVLLALDGVQLRSLPQLDWVLLHKHALDHVFLTIVRNSNKFILLLTLAEASTDSNDALAAVDIEENSLDKLGIVASARKHGTNEPSSKESTSGVLVVARLHRSEMQPELIVGDVIRSVNGVSVNSIAPLRALIDSFKAGDAIALQVERKGKAIYVAFEID